MMGHREKLKGAFEYDAFTGWRRVVKWQKSERSKIKRQFRRRIRRVQKSGLVAFLEQ